MSSTLLGSFVLERSPAENLPLMGVALAASMYWLGGRRLRAACARGVIDHRRRMRERWRTAAFLSGLGILVLALQQPVDSLADEYFWAHMGQHVLLLVVVAPLMILAAPWMRLWRAFPLSVRRPVAGWLAQSPAAAPLRGLARLLGRPWVIWSLLAVDMVAWHVPAAYDLTLESQAVHYAEHASFLFLSLLAWGQVIDSPPFRSRLDAPWRIAFAVGQMAVGWALAVLLAFASTPWYAFYADQRHRSLPALTDQHLAAGVMWVPASLPWSLLVFVLLYRWIAEPAAEEPPLQLVRKRVLPLTPLPNRDGGLAVPLDAREDGLAEPLATPQGNGDLAESIDRRIHA
jgi:putative membrane protein